ncbi:MAG: DUF4350 domain-containing protein [Euryarchaeota archaeon]|nr:DUF4350 domain-containing protein [Euryarchaeota archaeon]
MKYNYKKILVIICIVLFIAVLRFSQNTDDFSTYNPEWNGGKQIKNELSENHTVISMPLTDDLSAYDPGKTAFIILRPENNFSKKEMEIIKKFVENGGLLIVADDFGSGNDLLNDLTPNIAFSNLLMLDDVNYWENITFPVITSDLKNVSNITLNYPTTLIVNDTSVKILASSSKFSWLSKGDLDRGSGGSYPVIATTSSGKGMIIAIADPSIFINSMLPMTDNRLILQKLVENRNILIFDERMRMPLVSVIQYHIKNNPIIQYMFAASVILLSYIYMNRERLYPIKVKEKDNQNYISAPDEKEIISDIVKRNKWDHGKIQLFKNKLEGRK